MIDLRAGRAVHARGGDRASYPPVRSILCRGDDPLTLATAYRDALGLRVLYLADLDAIEGAPPDLLLLNRLAGAGILTRVDAGVKDGADVEALRKAGAETVIAATETLPGPARLAECLDSAGTDGLVFGLDLKDGRSVLAPGALWRSESPEGLIDEAARLGVRRFLILDTARVGSGRGLGHQDLVAALIARQPGAEFTVGGGVSGRSDLAAWERLGVSAVLVGSAFHDGRLGRDDLGA